MNRVENEGSAKLAVDVLDVVSKEQEVFYNPVMKHNRDVSVSMLRLISRHKQKQISAVLPLAGTGVRAIRFLKEVPDVIVFANDKDDLAVSKIHEHAKLNSIDENSLHISQNDASLFLLTQEKNDYIELDPFGSPNHFLDASIKSLGRGSVLAVTATDTAPLCGAYTLPCKRKYDAIPHNGSMCQEVGLRILIRKVQVIGAMYDKAMIPVFSYPKDHYMRCYFLCKKSKEVVDAILESHQFVNFGKNDVSFTVSPFNSQNFAGPLYTGPLFDMDFLDTQFFEDLHELSGGEKWINTIKEESEKNMFGYYDIHAVAEAEKIANLPKHDKIISCLEEKGFVAIRTVFNQEALRVNCSYDVLVECMKEL